MFQISSNYFSKMEWKHSQVKSTRSFRVLLAAGGTGGHIMPALATAEALRQRSGGSVECRFMCGRKEIERTIYKKAGEKPFVLPLDGMLPSIWGRTKGMAQMTEAVWKAHRAIVKWRPEAVVAFGGYSSVPAIMAAKWHGLPVYLQEQNAIPGRANRVFQGLAERVFLASAAARRTMKKKTRTVVTGNPIRQGSFGYRREQARRSFKVGNDAFFLLALGGSQGAEGMNQMLLDALARIRSNGGLARELSVLWISGPEKFEPLIEAIRESLRPSEVTVRHEEVIFNVPGKQYGMMIRLRPFQRDMGCAYAAADAALARAGAGTLAEILANGLPSILAPYPYAANDHQTVNSEALVAMGAAVLINEKKNKAAGRLESTLREWSGDPILLDSMARSASDMALPQAADHIAQLLIEDLLPSSIEGLEFKPAGSSAERE
jgi:UDP-N-acetylglucosamine--N-acetylmuramyl-(pentapeptide) pyrophosphoryl-undecaprenol N-acetylglucosamine transferase